MNTLGNGESVQRSPGGLVQAGRPGPRRHDAELLGISVDGVWCHLAYAASRKLHFPLLSDFQPRGAVAAAYGAFRASEWTSERALFVIDADGVVRWSHLSPVGI